MKKVFLLSLAFIILFCGCSRSKSISAPPIPNLNFSGTINVTYKDYDIECYIENSLETGCKIKILKPELLSGIEIKAVDGVCSLSLGDISYDIDTSKLRETEFVTPLAEVFENVLKTTAYEKLENGNWRYTGQTSYGEFVLIQDESTGYPISLEIPKIELYINFSLK